MECKQWGEVRNDHGKGICTSHGLRTTSAAEVCFIRSYPSQITVAKLCSLKQGLSTEQGCSPLTRALCMGSCNSISSKLAPLLWRQVFTCLVSGEVHPKHARLCRHWVRRVALSEFGGPVAEQNSLLIVPSNVAPSCRFGLPFVLHLEKTIAWDILQKEILEKMQYFLRPAACLQVRQTVHLF